MGKPAVFQNGRSERQRPNSVLGLPMCVHVTPLPRFSYDLLPTQQQYQLVNERFEPVNHKGLYQSLGDIHKERCC